MTTKSTKTNKSKSQTKKNRTKRGSQPKRFETMRTWFDKNGAPADSDRRAGMQAFADKIAGNLTEINKCRDAHYARTRFSEWGHFYVEGETPDPAWNFPPFGSDPDIKAIPRDTEFRVYGRREYRPERDKTVVLVVDNGQDGEPTNGTWRCTYSPYLDLKSRSRTKRRQR